MFSGAVAEGRKNPATREKGKKKETNTLDTAWMTQCRTWERRKSDKTDTQRKERRRKGKKDGKKRK